MQNNKLTKVKLLISLACCFIIILYFKFINNPPKLLLLTSHNFGSNFYLNNNKIKNVSFAFTNLDKKENRTFPSQYNFLNKYPNCKTPIFDQNQCFYCYAFATVSALSHRFCKKTGKFYFLNPHDLIYCDNFASGCYNGGHEYLSWRYIQYNGISNISCQPYIHYGSCNHSNKCKRFYIQYRSIKIINGEDLIQEEILKNGPVTALFQIREDFYSHKNGIYKTKNLEKLNELHTVEIIGWGIENNHSYWIIQNSYGKHWGEEGYFKMTRGINHLGIEEYATSALPLIK